MDRLEFFCDGKIAFTYILKDDFKNGLYEETLREEYLDSEEAALKKTEAKLDYFLDRFKQQSDFIKIQKSNKLQ